MSSLNRSCHEIAADSATELIDQIGPHIWVVFGVVVIHARAVDREHRPGGERFCSVRRDRVDPHLMQPWVHCTEAALRIEPLILHVVAQVGRERTVASGAPDVDLDRAAD